MEKVEKKYRGSGTDHIPSNGLSVTDGKTPDSWIKPTRESKKQFIVKKRERFL